MYYKLIKRALLIVKFIMLYWIIRVLSEILMFAMPARLPTV